MARRSKLGVKFTSSVAGQITALKFYRSPGDTGSDLLDLWTLDRHQARQRDLHQHRRERLADRHPGDAGRDLPPTRPMSRRITRPAPMWRPATSSPPPFTSGALTAPSTTTAGGNGVYAYGGTSTAGIFPTNTFSAANYWADVVFASRRPTRRRRRSPTPAMPRRRAASPTATGGSPATGNVLTNDTDPDAGDTKTVTAVSFGATAGTLGTRAGRSAWQPGAQCLRGLHLHRQRDRCRGAGACGNRPIR